MTPTPTASTTKVASAVPVLAKAPAAAEKMTVMVPPALVRAGTVTPPEQRSPSGRRPDAALPAWPTGVRVAVEGNVPKVTSSDDEASPIEGIRA